MNAVKARQILSEGHYDGTPNPLALGLQIIARYCADPEYLAMQNFVFVLGFDRMVPKMTEEEVVEMSRLGWFYDQQYAAWRFQIKMRPRV